METSKIIIAYFIYLPIIIGLTIYVSKRLFESGKSFMVEIFRGEEVIALATNKLFKVGFYLINIGMGLILMKISEGSGYYKIDNQTLIEVMGLKIGSFSIYLGVMLFLNLFLFLRGRKIVRQTKKPPVTPSFTTKQ
jgi:predicted PurR-regulated permease PerM